MMNNQYYKISDGWLTYFVNKATGEKKCKLDETDDCVEKLPDDLEKDIIR